MEGVCVYVFELALNKLLPISNSCTHTPPGPSPSYSSSNFFSFLRANSIMCFLYAAGYFFFHAFHSSRPSFFSLSVVSVVHRLSSGFSFAAWSSSPAVVVVARLFFLFFRLFFLGGGVFSFSLSSSLLSSESSS